jgi:HlyD family secretion protein
MITLVLACKGRGKKDEQYKTEKAERGDITMTVTATGTLSAVTTVQIGSQVSGVISRLYADFNSPVHKGQRLADLDPTSFQEMVDQKKADVTKAQVDAANAKITFERQDRLLKAGLAAQADVDAARTAYDGAAALVKQAVAALQQAQTNLDYTKIDSPIDGVVVDREYDVGQTVAASFQAPMLFAIAQDLTKMQVQADVDQSDIGRIQVGQVARFTVDAYPDQEFRGRISQIRLNATVSQNVVTYPVIIEVPNPDEKLHPKMTANVTIDVATVHDVLRIANAALRFKPDIAVEGAPPPGARGPNGRTSTTETSGTAGTTGTTGTAGTTATTGSAETPSPERAVAGMGQRRRGIAGAAGGFGSGMGGGHKTENAQRRNQTVWILEDPVTKKLKAVSIRPGITDGHYTEVVSGDLKIGDSVIVGLATSKVEGLAPPGSSGGPMGGRPGAGRGR